MGKITLETIAKKLDTSKNTVSKALRGLPGVSDELREKIINYAIEIGYVSNSSNRAANSVRQVNITLVCQKSFFMETSFWSQVFYGIMDYSGQNHVSIRTITIDSDADSKSSLLQISPNIPCDGYLVVGTVSDELLTKISKTSLPMVVVDYYNNDIECDYINSANSHGIYKAVQYLVQNNHKRIGFINNREGAYSFNQRYEAYIKYMELFGMPIDKNYIWHDAVYKDTNYYKEKLEKFYELPNFPTAWICVNDNTALAFYYALEEMKINVPDDISIIGFDNIVGMLPPFLTTVDVPQKAMGYGAMEQLMHRIESTDEPFVSIKINTTLIERNSVKKI